MCRFVLYMGPEISMSSLVTEPEHSIIVQSFKSQERKEPLNGDGFGVGWYSARDPDAAIFKAVSPAWNNHNLLNLSRVIRSHCILAHVRAASPGLPVTRFNCHPFSRGRLSFMHNGGISNFQSIKRQLCNSLSDAAYAWIQGSTDSEHIFALYTDVYAAIDGPDSADKMARALTQTLEQINEICRTAQQVGTCDYNLVVTDGRCAVVCRYSTGNAEPNSLHIHTGHRYSCHAGEINLSPCTEPTVLVASEPLTDADSWQTVAAGEMIVINASLEVEVRPLKAR